MFELRAVISLALLYAFRMLGLFMVLPVMMLYGDQYDGATPLLLGLALGIYGLTQACFQIPLGLLSDFVGRKPIIVGGLLVFAAGSLIAAYSTSVEGLVLGRALQGSGAIASSIMALVTDLTSEQNRTRAMAAIGASIGLSFLLAMILGPALASVSGLSGIFLSTVALAGIGIFIVLMFVPTPVSVRAHRDVAIAPDLVRKTVKNPQLLRLNWGIFSLHCILIANFVSLPQLLEVSLSMSREQHWKFYLPILILSFLFMLPLMLLAEKYRKIKIVFLLAVTLLAGSCLSVMLHDGSTLPLVVSIFIFFVAFNLLESLLPSLVSKISPAGAKGTAMGFYSTSQFLGAFFGGFVGGWLLQYNSLEVVFGFSAGLALLWGVVAVPMSQPRYLTSLRIPLSDPAMVEKVSNVRGVEESVPVVEESLLYLKVDRDRLDELALREMTDVAAK